MAVVTMGYTAHPMTGLPVPPWVQPRVEPHPVLRAVTTCPRCDLMALHYLGPRSGSATTGHLYWRTCTGCGHGWHQAEPGWFAPADPDRPRIDLVAYVGDRLQVLTGTPSPCPAVPRAPDGAEVVGHVVIQPGSLGPIRRDMHVTDPARWPF